MKFMANGPSSTPTIISISTSTVLKTIAILLALGLLWLIRDILLYIFIALLLAGVIYPFAQFAAARRIPKGLAVAVFYIFLFGIIGLAFSLLIPALLDQARHLLNTYGGGAGWVRELSEWIRNLSEQQSLVDALTSNVGGLSSQVRQIVSLLIAIFGGIAGFFIVLVLSFYLVVEDLAIMNVFRNFIPESYQEFVAQVARQVLDKLGAWLRGQLILGLVIGVLYFIGFSIIGVPYPLLLAMLGGLLEFIPYVGPFLAAIPAIFLASSDSWTRALMTLFLIILIQQLENNILVPKIMQKAVGLNPIVSIVAFMIGAQLFGVVGAIFAIPVATAISVALTESIRFHRGRRSGETRTT